MTNTVLETDTTADNANEVDLGADTEKENDRSDYFVSDGDEFTLEQPAPHEDKVDPEPGLKTIDEEDESSVT